MGFDNDHLNTLMPFGPPSTPSFADLSANGSSRTPERPFGRRRNATAAPGATVPEASSDRVHSTQSGQYGFFG
jgi:hypothetical protein